MFIGNAHSYADSNPIGDAYANTNFYSDPDAIGSTYCDPNTDSTATDTHANGNSNGHTNRNGYCNRYRYGYSNSNAYSESNPWECLLSANDGGPYSCSKHAVEFYGSGERDRCDVKDNFKRRPRSQRQWI